jgi:DNA primase catalytic core
MLKCIYHEDKTPSLQVNLEKNYYKCHSCGKTGDVIQFIEDYEKITKHEAIKKASSLIDNGKISEAILDQREKLKIENAEVRHPVKVGNPIKTDFLQKMFNYFKNAISNSKPAKDYLESRILDFKKIEVGYNSGQFHHGARKDEQLIKNSLDIGLLLDKGQTAKTGEKAYGVFGKWCIVFPLKNRENEIVSLYFRSILDTQNKKLEAGTSRHFYLKNRSGIYPGYPNPETKKLILTESIIDAASLLINNGKLIIDNEEVSVLACYGTNGLNEEILKAIKELKQLDEIIFAFDNDEAGRSATLRYAEQLKIYNEKLKISSIDLPNKDVNEVLQLHSEEIFTELLKKRREINFSTETERFANTYENNKQGNEQNQNTEVKKESELRQTGSPTDFLKQKKLIQNLNKEIGKAGIVGEENSRMLLFLIIISYLNKNPLHALVQGSSGSGKTHIISRIADLMPQEDVLRFTRITESSLYNWGEFDLFQKVVIIEDLDGLKDDALYALREFISNQVLRSSVTIKDKKGNNKSSHKIVKGQFSSLSATTKGETYEDNMSRSFLIAVDESKEQTARIIEYQNRRNAGEIDPQESQKAINFIQKIVRNLQVYEVINPYATQLHLPEKVNKIRRLNEMYQAVIKQVTFLNQYQRQIKNDQLITQIEDIEQATEILFESIVLKVDELDGSLRQFFERLKKYLKAENRDFTQREIRQEFNISKSQCSRFFIQLVELEYITLKHGGNLRLQKYVIAYWDNHQKLRTEIKDFLMNQIENIKKNQ